MQFFEIYIDRDHPNAVYVHPSKSEKNVSCALLRMQLLSFWIIPYTNSHPRLLLKGLDCLQSDSQETGQSCGNTDLNSARSTRGLRRPTS